MRYAVHTSDDLTSFAAERFPAEQVLARADWLLVGSRCQPYADDLSDWDTVLLTRDEVSAGERDHVLGVLGPLAAAATITDTLESHVARRSRGSVDIEVVGPMERLRRESEALVSWTHDLGSARVLYSGAGLSDAYRRHVENRFQSQRHRLMDEAYASFRLARNETAAALGRGAAAVQALTAGQCAIWAGRFWLLSAGEPHPGTKWLLAAMTARPDAADPVGCIDQLLDRSLPASTRYEAMWRLWRLVDQRACRAGVSPLLLDGTPFLS